MIAIKSSILLALFALSAKVIATPPACLLAAVKYGLTSSLHGRIITTDSLSAARRRILRTWAQFAVKMPPKFRWSSPPSAVAMWTRPSLHSQAHALALARPLVRLFVDTKLLHRADKFLVVASYSASATSTGSSNGTAIMTYTTESFDSSCSCTKTSVMTTAAAVTGSGMTSTLRASSTAGGMGSAGSAGTPSATGSSVGQSTGGASSQSVGSLAAAAIALAGVVAVL